MKFRWEYLIDRIDNTREKCMEKFDDLGCKEWELVSVDDGVAYFKRKIEIIECQLFTPR